MKLPRIFRAEEKANPIGASLLVGAGDGYARWEDRTSYIREGYQRNPVIYMAVEEIAKAIAGLRLELVRNKGKDSEEYLDEDHPVLKLLRRPNPMQGGHAFRKAVFIELMTLGEQAIAQPIGQRQPAELWQVDPGEVEVKPGRGGIPSAYIHRRSGQTTEFPVRGVTNPRADLFFYKRFNPTDYWRGQSPLMAGGIAGDIHNRGTDWNDMLLRNAAKPSGIVTFKEGDPSDETVRRLKEWFKRAFQGSANAGEVPVLTGGAEWKQTSLSPLDMDFGNSMTEAKKLIAGVYGVPLPLIDNEAATFANMEMAKERFYIDTVLPLANEWLEAFGAWLLPAWGDDLTLCIDMDDIPALEAVRNRKFDRVMKALGQGIITMDEARDEIGYAPLTTEEDDGTDAEDAAAKAYGNGQQNPR